MKVLVKRQNTQTSSSLFHSSTYYGQEFDDGLRHWKYIKREKLPDGKYPDLHLVHVEDEEHSIQFEFNVVHDVQTPLIFK